MSADPDGVPPLPPALDPGAPQFAWFDGIVEGRLGDASVVRAAATRLNASGFGRMDVGVDGGRFSVLMDDATVPAARMTDANRGVLSAALTEIAAATAGPLESTLRCTEVFQNEVRETLFLPEAGAIRALTRTRPVAPADLYRSPAAPPPASSMGRGRLLAVAALLVVAFGLAAWMSGWVDQLLSAKAETLAIDAGPFAEFIDVTAEKSWGDYKVVLRRGKGFPIAADRIAELRAKADTPAARAAVEAVATGGDIWLRVEDAKGRVLAARNVELRPLLSGADRKVETEVPGRITAARLHLDIDAGNEDK